MKRKISLLLCTVMLLGFIAVPVSAVTDIEVPTDVPKIIIITTDEINRDDYVDATIKVIDEEGGEYATIEDTESEIKIRGNSTSSADKKPYNIKFSSKTDVLGMGKNKKWSLLANCYDKTLLRNISVFEFAKLAGVPYTPDYRVVDVYVNDTFMGSYLCTDSIEVSSTRVDIDTDDNEYLLELDWNPEDEDCYYFYTPANGTDNTNCIKFAINEPEKEDLTQEQIDWVTNFITEAEAALASGDYQRASEYFDMESMVNFYITLEYFKNVDVNTSSTRFHIKDGKIYGGPVWDFDLSSGNCNDDYYYGYNKYTTNDIESNISYEDLWAVNVPWFKKLMSMSTFKSSVCDRYLELQDDIVNLYADNINGQNRIDYYLETYEGTISRNHNEAGWDVDKVHNPNLQLERDPFNQSYEDHIAFYRHWLMKRNEWLLNNWGLESLIEQTNDKYSTMDGYLVHVMEKTYVSNLLADFGSDVTLLYDGVELTAKDYVPSGSILTVGGASYTAVVKGDVLEDGVVNAFDYIVIKRCCLKTMSLDYINVLAADISGNDKVDAIDFIMLKRYVLGSYNIYK